MRTGEFVRLQHSKGDIQSDGIPLDQAKFSSIGTGNSRHRPVEIEKAAAMSELVQEWLNKTESIFGSNRSKR